MMDCLNGRWEMVLGFGMDGVIRVVCLCLGLSGFT